MINKYWWIFVTYLLIMSFLGTFGAQLWYFVDPLQLPPYFSKNWIILLISTEYSDQTKGIWFKKMFWSTVRNKWYFFENNLFKKVNVQNNCWNIIHLTKISLEFHLTRILFQQLFWTFTCLNKLFSKNLTWINLTFLSQSRSEHRFNQMLTTFTF